MRPLCPKRGMRHKPPKTHAPSTTVAVFDNVFVTTYFRHTARMRGNGKINEAVWGEEVKIRNGLMLTFIQQ